MAAGAHPSKPSLPLQTNRLRPGSLAELLRYDNNQLACVDIDRMNLLCALGLPGSEDLNLPMIEEILSQWVPLVAKGIAGYEHLFENNPEQFANDHDRFKIISMVTILQKYLGVVYNELWKNPNYWGCGTSKDVFIHGMVTYPGNNPPNGGMCVSLPVLYTAIGRKIGLPLKLVLAQQHVFARWDGDENRFNIEGTNRGVTFHDDEHYKTWPGPITEAQINKGIYLKSLTPAEELAEFMSYRAQTFRDHQRWEEAAGAYKHAARLAPHQPKYHHWYSDMLNAARNTQSIEASKTIFEQIATPLHTMTRHGDFEDYLNDASNNKTHDIPTSVVHTLFPPTPDPRHPNELITLPTGILSAFDGPHMKAL